MPYKKNKKNILNVIQILQTWITNHYYQINKIKMFTLYYSQTIYYIKCLSRCVIENYLME